MEIPGTASGSSGGGGGLSERLYHTIGPRVCGLDVPTGQTRGLRHRVYVYVRPDQDSLRVMTDIEPTSEMSQPAEIATGETPQRDAASVVTPRVVTAHRAARIGNHSVAGRGGRA